MIRKTTSIIILSFSTFVLFFLCTIFFCGYRLITSNVNIHISQYLNRDLLYDVNVSYNGSKKLYCSLDKKSWKKIEECNFKLGFGEYKLYLKSGNLDTFKSFTIKKDIKGSFSSSLDNVDKYYLALGGTKDINFSFNYKDSFDKTIYWDIENEEIVEINNSTIKGLKSGTTNITAILRDGNKKTYTIEVTDLIVPMKLDNNKKIVPCGHYTSNENALLDEILESRVLEAGDGTRGGVIAAIRFITMEFPYAVPYFYENGRLIDNGYRPHLDGEGRYYHKGLYLSKSKYETLENGATSKNGPKMWGCDLYSTTTKQFDANGLDCSGFVSWAMLNGGFDVGDVGAGDYKEFDTDLSDLGKKNKITKDYIENGNYKVGDFIAKNGHAALIIGIDDKNIYTAESLPPKVKVYTYSKNNKILNTSNLNYIIEMDGIYPNGDGIYTDML